MLSRDDQRKIDEARRLHEERSHGLSVGEARRKVERALKNVMLKLRPL